MTKFRRRTEIVTFALMFLMSAGTDELVNGENGDCSAVKTVWRSHGLGAHMVPDSPLPGL